MEMRKFYESQYEELDQIIDEVAERVRALGEYSSGRLTDFSALTRLEEPSYTSQQNEQLKNLLRIMKRSFKIFGN